MRLKLPMRLWITSTPTLALAAIAAAAATILGPLAPTDAMLTRSFSTALAELPVTSGQAIGLSKASYPVAGSEHDWLVGTAKGLKARADASAEAPNGLKIGARMMITDASGAARSYRAVDIRPIDGGLVRTATSAESGAMVLVVWREIGASASPPAEMRVIMDAAAVRDDAAIGQPHVL